MKLNKNKVLNKKTIVTLGVILVILCTLHVSYAPTDSVVDEPKSIVRLNGSGVTSRTENKFKPHNIALDVELQEYLWDVCQEADMKFELQLAVIYQESRFDMNLSHTNKNGTIDKGLSQINNKYQDWYAKLAGIEPELFDPYNPRHSIRAGVYGLKFWKEEAIRYGFDGDDLVLGMLNMYNMGYNYPKACKKKGITISRRYDQIILNYTKTFK